MSRKLPLCSSRDVITALERAGFSPGPSSSGSHRSYYKTLADGTVRVAIVVLGKKEIPRGTLGSILDQAGISPRGFAQLLRRRPRIR